MTRKKNKTKTNAWRSLWQYVHLWSEWTRPAERRYTSHRRSAAGTRRTATHVTWRQDDPRPSVQLYTPDVLYRPCPIYCFVCLSVCMYLCMYVFLHTCMHVCMVGECRIAGVAVATPTLPVPHQHFALLSLLATPTLTCWLIILCFGHTNFGNHPPPMHVWYACMYECMYVGTTLYINGRQFACFYDSYLGF